MADVANSVVVSKENRSDLVDNKSPSECSDTNQPKSSPHPYSDVDTFSDLSFKTNDDISLQDLIESEFAARISSLSNESSPREETPSSDQPSCLLDFKKSPMSNEPFNLLQVDDRVRELNLDEFISGPLKGDDSFVTGIRDAAESDDQECATTNDSNLPILANFNVVSNVNPDLVYDASPVSESNPDIVCVNNADIVCENGTTAEPDLVAFKPARPAEMPLVSSFDPFARIEEDSDASNSNPISGNVLNSPDEFPFPESPQEARMEEPMVDLFVKTVSDENLDLSDPGNNDFSRFQTSSVESVNNSYPNVSDLTSPDHQDHDEFFSDDLISTEPVETVVEQEDGTSSVSQPVDLSTEETECGLEDQSLHQVDQTEEDWMSENVTVNPPEADPPDFECRIHLASPDGDPSTPVNETSDGRNDVCEETPFDGAEEVPEPEDDWLLDQSAPVMAPIATTEEDSEEWTTVAAALVDTETKDSVDNCVTNPPDLELVEMSVPNKDADVTNAAVAVLSPTNAPDILVMPAEEIERSDASESETETRSESSSSEKRTTKKKKTTSSENGIKKTKKTKKSEEKENHISVSGELTDSCSPLSPAAESCPALSPGVSSVDDTDDLLNVSVRDLKSSFSKFDQLSKKTVLHVRSVDSGKVQKQFNDASAGAEQSSNCKSCGKMVFQMEQIKAERAVWHKNCFRCKECSKQLTVDTYSSHEGVVYCKPHFKELFKPKAVIEDEPELTSDKPDLGLEELSSLNVRSRFQVFEKQDEGDGDNLDRSPSNVNVKRSPSILSKLAKFQKKGMDIGVTDDSLNGVPYDQSPSSTEEEEEEEEEDESTNRKVVKSKKIRERPVSFGKMEDVKSVWENGVAKTKEELRQERKEEIQQIRSRLFMGKQVKMKEAYEQAVRESEQTSQRKSIDVKCDKAKSIKECFEKGEPLNIDDDEEGGEGKGQNKSLQDDSEMFEAGISKKSRSLFLELDKTAAQGSQNGVPKPLARTPSAAAVRPREAESPVREVYHDPSVVRASDRVEPEIVRTNTTAKMLSLFRQMEERTEEVPDGPKPLKCFTPPPDYKEETEESEEESEEEDEEEDEEEVNPNLVRSSDKVEDDFLKQAANAARAKQLRAKFERWEEKEIEREKQEQSEKKVNGTNTAVEIVDSSENVEITSIECTKNLRARFESMKTDTEAPKEKVVRPKVNRFVEIQNTMEALCEVCRARVYQLERVETSGKIFHKSCFRCVQCNCLLRLETFTLNCGRLYCMPHFKQLFIVKGNYDEGFGVDQHKAKWSRVASTC